MDGIGMLLKAAGVNPEMISQIPVLIQQMQKAAIQAVETLQRIETKIDALEKHLTELETSTDGEFDESKYGINAGATGI